MGLHEKYEDAGDYIDPTFSIDEEGRVICESHSEIDTIHKLKQESEMTYQYEAMLTCNTCKHYLYDDCYFPKSEIDKIEADRRSSEIHCVLCGNKIDRPLTIIHSLYHKEKYGVDIPVICCSCYSSLDNNSFLKTSKKRLFFVSVSLLISAYFLVSYFITIMMFSFWGILLFVIPFLFWGYISFRDIKNIYYLWKGRKYYQEYFSPPSEPMNEAESEESTKFTPS